MNQKEKIFADGFSFKRNENAPDFVVGRMSVKVEDAVMWLKSNAKNGWVNMDIKQSKGGNYYCELDTWEAKPKAEATQTETVEENLPF
jgi:hypothetical protein